MVTLPLSLSTSTLGTQCFLRAMIIHRKKVGVKKTDFHCTIRNSFQWRLESFTRVKWTLQKDSESSSRKTNFSVINIYIEIDFNISC